MECLISYKLKRGVEYRFFNKNLESFVCILSSLSQGCALMKNSPPLEGAWAWSRLILPRSIQLPIEGFFMSSRDSQGISNSTLDKASLGMLAISLQLRRLRRYCRYGKKNDRPRSGSQPARDTQPTSNPPFAATRFGVVSWGALTCSCVASLLTAG